MNLGCVRLQGLASEVPGKSPLPPRYSAHTAYVRSPDFFSSQSVGQFLVTRTLCPNFYTLFSRKQAQNARFQSLKTSGLGVFSRKLGLYIRALSNHMDRQARNCQCKHYRGGWRSRGKDDRKQNALALLQWNQTVETSTTSRMPETVETLATQGATPETGRKEQRCCQQEHRTAKTAETQMC